MHPHDIILLDIYLLDIDGFEIARRLRADPSTAGTPIVAVSAASRRENLSQALAAGCNEYMEKPINVRTFGQDVMRHVARE